MAPCGDVWHACHQNQMHCMPVSWKHLLSIQRDLAIWCYMSQKSRQLICISHCIMPDWCEHSLCKCTQLIHSVWLWPCHIAAWDHVVVYGTTWHAHTHTTCARVCACVCFVKQTMLYDSLGNPVCWCQRQNSSGVTGSPPVRCQIEMGRLTWAVLTNVSLYLKNDAREEYSYCGRL